MGSTVLSDILSNWGKYELDDSVYLPVGAQPSLDLPVSVFPFDRTRKRVFEDQEYFLGIEQVRDILEGLDEQLGRTATPEERLRAVVHYVVHDAYIDAAMLRNER